MTKAEQFVFLVQTGAICYTLSNGRGPDTAVYAVAGALAIPEARLPDDLAEAASEYLALQYATRLDPAPVPAWLRGHDPY